MKRTLTKKLVEWKNQTNRKPVVIDGARQVGKSYLVEEEFGFKNFKNCFKFDFSENKKLEQIFTDSLDPQYILDSLELELGKKINTKSDLIFFDEVGDCQRAVESLKYFSEKRPDIFLVSSGSNIGLLDSFPVGKTYNLELFPMSFYEFLLASENKIIIDAFEQQSRNISAHDKLWKYLLDYYFVGGMPEAVKSWFSYSSIIDKIESVSQIHKDLFIGYDRDFGKYGGKINALHISSVFKEIPFSLQKAMDQSVKRFTFKEVVPGKKQYSELRGPIDWLEKSKLVSKNFIIRNQPKAPLKSGSKENFFKLFFFDVGLLCHALGLSYQEIIQQSYFEKGYLAENFVQNELRAIGVYPTFSWAERNSEIEFIIKTKKGLIIPVEVKSGKRTVAKSLRVYKEKYKPKKTIKLIGNRGGENETDIVWPLYYSHYLKKIIFDQN